MMGQMMHVKVIAILSFLVLGGCVERTSLSQVTLQDEVVPAVDNQTASTQDEQNDPLSLVFRWPLSDSTLISPPVEIQNEAIKKCHSLGYDTGYMVNIGIDGDEAVGEFGCRGAD